MFFNLYRSTKAAQKEYERSKLSTIGQSIISPQQRLLNFKKRQKVKDILLAKFANKYKINQHDEQVENEITKFIQGDKLSDIDLQNLDHRLEKIISKNKLSRNLNPSLSQNLLDKNSLPSINNNKNSSLDQAKDQSNLENKKLRPSASCEILPKYKIYKNPEEELAELEAEFAEEEKNKKPLKRLDFSGLGNEWYAMAQYNKLLYDRQIKEEKLKDAEMKRRTKEDLDNQVREKLKLELEEKIKEKEANEIFIEHLKKMDKIEKEKQELIQKKIERERASREAQIKQQIVKKKIDILKNKKFEKNMIKTIQEEIEKEKNEAILKRKKENEALRKVLMENEVNREKVKELRKKAKQEDIDTYKEMELNEIKKDLERKRYFDNIKRFANKYDEKMTQNILDEIKQQEKEGDEKAYQSSLQQQKKEEERELKEKIKKKEDKIKLMKYLDKQIEEKKKEVEFMKSLDEEQGRIWKIDEEIYKEQQKKIDKIIKNMNRRNLDSIMEQMKNKRENQQKKEIMTLDEYAINREFLEKAKEELELQKK